MGLKAGEDSHVAPREPDEPQEIVDFCARPKCREEFRRTVGPGRRQAYCSEFCRRSAERELRQTKSRLQHFEELVAQLRVDVAAFGRSAAGDSAEHVNVLDTQQNAEVALARVAGILAFPAAAGDPLLHELRSLYDAVAPLLASKRSH